MKRIDNNREPYGRMVRKLLIKKLKMPFYDQSPLSK